MAYLVLHHETFWFQIRVPAPLVDRYGRLIRQNLQTNNRAQAQQLAHQLAGHWLTRFYAERSGPCEFPTMEVHSTDAGMPHTQPVDTISMRPLTAPVIPGEPATGNEKVLEIADSFEALSRYWRTLHPECSPSTFSEVASVVKGFSKAIAKSPGQLERIDIAAYRDRLITSGLARATVAKKVSFVSTLLQTAVDTGALPHNVARGMHIPKPKVASVNRRAFTPDELRRIVTSPVYSQRRRYNGGGGEAAAWVPLLALGTGARLEEICQLRVANLCIDREYGPLLHITDADAGQHVKTESSRRIIPVHRALVNAGLLNYRDDIEADGSEWLFPALEPDHDGRRGGNFGKWFARYLRSPRGCAIRDRQVVFHSFRHLFKTLCRAAGLPEEVHDALTGHAGPTGVSVGRAYGHMPLPILVDAIARIRFPIALPTVDC